MFTQRSEEDLDGLSGVKITQRSEEDLDGLPGVKMSLHGDSLFEGGY